MRKRDAPRLTDQSVDGDEDAPNGDPERHLWPGMAEDGTGSGSGQRGEPGSGSVNLRPARGRPSASAKPRRAPYASPALNRKPSLPPRGCVPPADPVPPFAS